MSTFRHIAWAAGAVIAAAAPASAQAFSQVEWERTIHPNTPNEQVVTMRTSDTITNGVLTGSLPEFNGSSWPLTTGYCWTGVGGTSFDGATCAFVAPEEQTRAARCERTRRVRRRVTIHRHGHRKRVWRYRYVTTRFTRDVRVFLQMELANHNADYSGAGQPTYFYADIQSEYGNSPASTYP
ncbi:MAG: hypothetical protein QOI80_3432, partial [Solirubrobacteraceae bacterium]|nr:hypothetical protein [Solirubrobacteraceae bacterium]